MLLNMTVLAHDIIFMAALHYGFAPIDCLFDEYEW